MSSKYIIEQFHRHRFLAIWSASLVVLIIIATIIFSLSGKKETSARDELAIGLEESEVSAKLFPEYADKVEYNFSKVTFPIVIGRDNDIFIETMSFKGLDIYFNAKSSAEETENVDAAVMKFLFKSKRLICVSDKYIHLPVNIHVVVPLLRYIPTKYHEKTLPLSEVCKLSDW